MRIVFVVLIFFIGHVGFSQSLKKKYTGVYQGEMKSYVLHIDDQLIQIDAAPIVFNLGLQGECEEQIGDYARNASYVLVQEDKTTIQLEVRIAGQLIAEQYLLYKKEKKILRKGLFPQPEVVLKKN